MCLPPAGWVRIQLRLPDLPFSSLDLPPEEVLPVEGLPAGLPAGLPREAPAVPLDVRAGFEGLPRCGTVALLVDAGALPRDVVPLVTDGPAGLVGRFRGGTEAVLVAAGGLSTDRLRLVVEVEPRFTDRLLPVEDLLLPAAAPVRGLCPLLRPLVTGTPFDEPEAGVRWMPAVELLPREEEPAEAPALSARVRVRLSRVRFCFW